MYRVLNCFDDAYVINVAADTHRMSKVANRLARLEIPFRRVSALPPHKTEALFDPCVYSHIEVLHQIMASDADTALILEDDVVFRDDTPVWMSKMADEINSQSWDLLHLGLHLHETGESVTRHLAPVKRGNQTHAYAVRKSSIPRILDCIRQTLASSSGTFDGFVYNSLVRLYTNPILAIQEPEYSYTYDRVVDRLAQYFSYFDGADFEQNCAEMRTWHSNWRSIAEVLQGLKALRQRRPEIAIECFRKALERCPELQISVKIDVQRLCDGRLKCAEDNLAPADPQEVAETLLEEILLHWQPEIEKFPLYTLDPLRR
jgi:hypothetical protein